MAVKNKKVFFGETGTGSGTATSVARCEDLCAEVGGGEGGVLLEETDEVLWIFKTKTLASIHIKL